MKLVLIIALALAAFLAGAYADRHCPPNVGGSNGCRGLVSCGYGYNDLTAFRRI